MNDNGSIKYGKFDSFDVIRIIRVGVNLLKAPEEFQHQLVDFGGALLLDPVAGPGQQDLLLQIRSGLFKDLKSSAAHGNHRVELPAMKSMGWPIFAPLRKGVNSQVLSMFRYQFRPPRKPVRSNSA